MMESGCMLPVVNLVLLTSYISLELFLVLLTRIVTTGNKSDAVVSMSLEEENTLVFQLLPTSCLGNPN